ncbi:MAG: LVIVD repeat-containing protein [Candidatus Heimdallarchaeota archaeon]
MIGKKNSLVFTIIVLFVASSYIIAMELPTIVGQVNDDNNDFFDVNASLVNFTNAGTWNENFYYGSHVEIYNDSAYVLAAPNGILSFDISDPNDVQKQDVFRVGSDVQNFEIDWGIIYIADAQEGLILTTWDFSLIDTIDLNGSAALDVAVDESYAFVACGPDGVIIVDCGNPSDISIVGAITGAMYNVQSITISDHIAYLSTPDNGFSILNVTDPTSHEVWIEGYDSTKVNHIEVDGETMYVARDAGVEIFNHTVLGAPAPKGTYVDTDYCLETTANEGILYVANERGGIDIVNVTNENTPVFVSNIETPFTGWATGVTYKADHIYFVDAPNGLKGFNVTDASNPIQTLEYGIVGYAFDLAVDEDVVYLSNGNITLSTVNVFDPYAPEELGQWDGYTFTTQIEYYGGYVFVKDMLGILVFDVTDPSNPELHMNLTGSEFVQKFYVNNNTLYILYEDELEIWFIHDPLNYYYVSTTEITGTFLRDLIVLNETIYVLDSDDVIHVLDSTDYYSLEEIGTYTCRGNSKSFYYYQELLFISCYEFLEVVDVSVKTNPTYANNYTGFSSYTVNDISISDGLLYVALGQDGLKVLDIRSAYYLKTVGSMDTKGYDYFQGVEVHNDTAYIAAGQGGLRIAEIDADLDPIPENNFTGSPTIVIPGYTILSFTTGIIFLGVIAIFRRRRN